MLSRTWNYLLSLCYTEYTALDSGGHCSDLRRRTPRYDAPYRREYVNLQFSFYSALTFLGFSESGHIMFFEIQYNAM